MKKKTLLKGGILLAVFSLLSKGIGALYRLPLTNVLGAEGLGAYQMAYPVYALLVACSSSAIPVLVSRSLPSMEDHDLRSAFFNSTLKYAVFIGLISGLLLAVAGKGLSILQGSDVAVYGYYALSPAVFFVAVLASFRGWFNSRLETLTTSISGLIEQIVKVVGVVLAYVFSARGVAFSLSMALIGVTLSEIVACGFAFLAYLKKGGRFLKSVYVIPVKAVALSILPLSVGSLIFPLATFADSLMTVKLLTIGGLLENQAIQEYGILSGSVGTLINLPVSLALSFAVTALPVIAERKRQKDINGIKSNGISSYKAVLSIALPSALGLVLISKPLVNLIYGTLSSQQKILCVTLLRLACLEIPLASLLQLFNAHLQALDKGVTAAKNMLIGGLVKLALNFTVLYLGVSGIILGTIACYSVCLALDVYALRVLVGRTKTDVLPITLASVTMGVAVYLVVKFVKNNLYATLFGVLLGGIVYVIILLTLRTIKKRFVQKDRKTV